MVFGERTGAGEDWLGGSGEADRKSFFVSDLRIEYKNNGECYRITPSRMRIRTWNGLGSLEWECGIEKGIV